MAEMLCLFFLRKNKKQAAPGETALLLFGLIKGRW